MVCADGRMLAAGQVIVAAGIWSDRFTRQCRYRVPLESERGYHVNLPKAGVALRHFIQCASESFVILPLADGGLRLAGTVELAHRDAAPDWRRAEILLDKARGIVGDFSTEDMTLWMGNRPSLPDTVPVIGPAPGSRRPVFRLRSRPPGPHAGRHHRRALLRDMVLQRPSGLDLHPYRLARF
ncbi:FAD-binding oxidoreductase [Chromobacterium haemolyticum]|nr:FAD-binding oxidoreductase [Chromobacterium haemolyticum]